MSRYRDELGALRAQKELLEQELEARDVVALVVVVGDKVAQGRFELPRKVVGAQLGWRQAGVMEPSHQDGLLAGAHHVSNHTQRAGASRGLRRRHAAASSCAMRRESQNKYCRSPWGRDLDCRVRAHRDPGELSP